MHVRLIGSAENRLANKLACKKDLVSILSTFYAHAFLRKCFFRQNLAREKLLTYKKRARKMLMKLTPKVSNRFQKKADSQFHTLKIAGK